jgi:hypothetical protein
VDVPGPISADQTVPRVPFTLVTMGSGTAVTTTASTTHAMVTGIADQVLGDERAAPPHDRLRPGQVAGAKKGPTDAT